MNKWEIENVSAGESGKETFLKEDKKPTKRKKSSKPKTAELQVKKKFTVRLRKKRKNTHNPKEETRLERLFFGEPSDGIDNLLNDKKAASKLDVIKEPSIHLNQPKNDIEDSDDEDLELENASAGESVEETFLKEDEKPMKRKKTAKLQFKKKCTVPLRNKGKNIYNPTEETRLERLVLREPSDAIDNLLQEETASKPDVIQEPSVHSNQPKNEIEDSDDEDLELENASTDESGEETLLNEDDELTRRKKALKRKTERLEFKKKHRVPRRKKRKNTYNPKEEARLEGLIFGGPNDVINNLLNDEEAVSKPDVIKEPSVHLTQPKNEIEDSDDEDLEVKLDEPKAEKATDDDSGVDDKEAKDFKMPAWEDDDDGQYTVHTALRAQGRRLPGGRPEKTYNELLQNKFKQLVGTPKWAELNREKERASDDSDDEILRHSSHFTTPKVKKLQKGTIEIKALSNINKQTRTEGPVVTSLQFHPSSTVALVAGLSGILSIFQIDGIENSKLHSMQYERFPINTAKFIKEGSEIVSGSQHHTHCHAYDLIAGKNYKVPLPDGITNMKIFEISPDGKLIALCGRMGEIHILTSRTKELVGTLKMNNRCNTLAFSPDSRKLFTHGEGGEMYVWDMTQRACIHRAMDDGCLAGSTIAVSPSGQFLATGSKQGVVNVYDMDTVLQKKNPKPLKIILNLVTAITSLKFNPTSEILAMASNEKENAFKIVHLPSITIFSNFPNFQAKMFNPLATEFSPSSGYLGICNNKGSAYLYRLKHYGNY